MEKLREPGIFVFSSQACKKKEKRIIQTQALKSNLASLAQKLIEQFYFVEKREWTLQVLGDVVVCVVSVVMCVVM